MKILQITCDLNWGSIGHITEDIGILAQREGWEVYVIYGRDHNSSKLTSFKSSSKLDVYEHFAEHRLIDNDGLASRNSTKKAIRKINEIQPDIILLHNIHDHWLNYEQLFEYLSCIGKPVIWTQHDCWSYTGGCGYYSLRGCVQWKTECQKCPMKRGALPLVERTKIHFEKKRRLFNAIKNLTLVPVSYWLEGELRQSFLKEHKIRTIYNGVNTSLFKPCGAAAKERYGIGDKKLLVGAATVWSERKGLNDYVALSKILPQDIIVLLIGLSSREIKCLPNGIIGLQRTQNIEELAAIYSAADIVLNLSYEETFGLTTVEGLACGTPGVVYNCAASPELIIQETGLVVEKGNITGVAKAVNEILSNGKAFYTEKCRERAVTLFNKDDRFADYINLYEELVSR